MIPEITSKYTHNLNWVELERRFNFPLHIIFPQIISDNAKSFRKSLNKIYSHSSICFAVKSNPCRGAISYVSKLGLGVDVVSEYELSAALEEGVNPGKILCNGNAKTDNYLKATAVCGALLAVDGEMEAERYNQISAQHHRKSPVLIRFSGMPLEGYTHADQTTASYWTKFGFDYNEADRVINSFSVLKNLEIVGISAHIGTQICDFRGYVSLIEHLLNIANLFIRNNIPVLFIDIGGGFPLNYVNESEWVDFTARLRNQLNYSLLNMKNKPPMVSWDNIPMGYAWKRGEVVKDDDPWKGKSYWSQYPAERMVEIMLTTPLSDGKCAIERLSDLGNPRLILEPGRALLGSAGITAAKVVNVKSVMDNFVVALDLGIVNHGTLLITPDIYPVSVFPLNEDDQPIEVFLAGRLCFTGDMISKVKVTLNRLPKRDDLVLLHYTGAYCADHFASNSCGFPLPGKIAFYDDGSIEVWRKPQSFRDVFSDVSS